MNILRDIAHSLYKINIFYINYIKFIYLYIYLILYKILPN